MMKENITYNEKKINQPNHGSKISQGKTKYFELKKVKTQHIKICRRQLVLVF